MGTAWALEADGVAKTFPGNVRALVDVDLRVAQGETVALVGESGSGKTTLLRMFNLLERPTAGAIRIGGRGAGELDPIRVRRATGYVQQAGGLLPHWTVRRNVELVPRLSEHDPGAVLTRADELLEMVGLDPRAYSTRYPHELSGGQRQRVAFARALAADPDTVLLDEPFGALDALTRADLQEEFARLKDRLGKTVVLVTHDLGEAFLLGDRVAVLRDGRILRCDTPERLRADPGDPYVAELLRRGGGVTP